MNRYELWWLAFLVVGSFVEIWNNFHGKPTLTDFALRFLSKWIIMPVLTWAWFHFASNYFGVPKWMPSWLAKFFLG